MASRYKFKSLAYLRREKVQVPIDVTLEIEWQKIVDRLGSKAINNRSGKAVGLSGLIVVRAKRKVS